MKMKRLVSLLAAAAALVMSQAAFALSDTAGGKAWWDDTPWQILKTFKKKFCIN